MVSKFKLADTKRFPLPGTNNRVMHLATIYYGLREFVYFKDNRTQRVYVEEITGGQLHKINDDNLWNDLGDFLEKNGLTNIFNL